MAGVFYFINPEDNVAYFMSGVVDPIFTPIPSKATFYTTSTEGWTFSLISDGVTVPIYASTRLDPTYRDISIIEYTYVINQFSKLFPPGQPDNPVNGIRYEKAILNEQGTIIGVSPYINYLQFPSYFILFTWEQESPETIALNQIPKREVYDGKVTPQKGETKQNITQTLHPIVNIAVYILVIIAVLILFSLVRSMDKL